MTVSIHYKSFDFAGLWQILPTAKIYIGSNPIGNEPCACQTARVRVYFGLQIGQQDILLDLSLRDMQSTLDFLDLFSKVQSIFL